MSVENLEKNKTIKNRRSKHVTLSQLNQRKILVNSKQNPKEIEKVGPQIEVTIGALRSY